MRHRSWGTFPGPTTTSSVVGGVEYWFAQLGSLDMLNGRDLCISAVFRRCRSRPQTSISYSSSPSCSAATAVSVPNSPSCSWLIPAVKNNELYGPALPAPIPETPFAELPNVSAHKPSMVRTCSPVCAAGSSKVLTSPMNRPLKPLYAAISPLPKFPTSTRLLNSPKSRGVHTTPQGELSQGPYWRRVSSLPEGL